MINYTLNGKTPVPCEDLMEWVIWFQTAERTVALSETDNGNVSTVFLGTDHNFFGGTPILFETMVFGGTLDQEQERYATWDEAIDGHNEMVARVMEGVE